MTPNVRAETRDGCAEGNKPDATTETVHKIRPDGTGQGARGQVRRGRKERPDNPTPCAYAYENT